MKKDNLVKQIDWVSILVPLAIVIVLCASFIIVPEQSKAIVTNIRGFLGDDFGLYYGILGLGIFAVTVYIAFTSIH